jgi:chorismate synthase
MEALITQLKAEGDSVGGVITAVATGLPAGLGDPVFDKLEADLAKAMLSINAVKGFEIGSGFAAAAGRGSQFNDPFEQRDGRVRTQSNHSSGIQGGISNGEDVYFRVAFKPVATIGKAQQTVDTSGAAAELQAKGRHDPCVVPRAVPIVEAMTALVLADHWLRSRMAKV